MATKAELEAKADTLRKELAAAEAAAAAMPATPTDPEEIFIGLLTAIVSHLGNPPRIENLLKAFMATGKSAPPAPAPAEPTPEPTPSPIILTPPHAGN